ncbi:MAG: hypothetical protein Q9170_000807 [Blastenia crenularia]
MLQLRRSWPPKPRLPVRADLGACLLQMQATRTRPSNVPQLMLSSPSPKNLHHRLELASSCLATIFCIPPLGHVRGKKERSSIGQDIKGFILMYDDAFFTAQGEQGLQRFEHFLFDSTIRHLDSKILAAQDRGGPHSSKNVRY